MTNPIEQLAALIREVDGENKLGAGALAERLVERGVSVARVSEGLCKDHNLARPCWFGCHGPYATTRVSEAPGEPPEDFEDLMREAETMPPDAQPGAWQDLVMRFVARRDGAVPAGDGAPEPPTRRSIPGICAKCDTPLTTTVSCRCENCDASPSLSERIEALTPEHREAMRVVLLRLWEDGYVRGQHAPATWSERDQAIDAALRRLLGEG